MSEHRDPAGLEQDDWLDVLLRAYQPATEAFHERFERVVDSALAVAQLRQAKERRGLPLVGIPALLRALAAGSREAVAAASAWAGLDLRTPTTPEAAGAWARLAAALGLRRDEALFHLRMTFAESLGPEFMPSAVSLRRDAEPDADSPAITVADLNDQLEAQSRRWHPTAREDQRACELAMNAAWEQSEIDHP
jgi:hypothetical protein